MNDRQRQKKKASASPTSRRKDQHIRKLTNEVAYRTRLQKICNKINAAANLDELLINLKDDITSLFEAERITVYIADKEQRQLTSGKSPSCTDVISYGPSWQLFVMVDALSMMKYWTFNVLTILFIITFYVIL